MKKIILLLIIVLFFISCGPHRMKCGPGKCGLDETNSEIEKIKNSKNLLTE